MKIVYWFALLVALGGLTITSRLAAQQGPNSADTVQWIQSHLPAAVCGEFKVTEEFFYDPTAGGCHRPTADSPWILSGPVKMYFRDVVSIAVKSVSETDAHGATTRRPRVEMRSSGMQTVGALFLEGETDDANRLAKALRHLAQMNGAKLTDDNLF